MIPAFTRILRNGSAARTARFAAVRTSVAFKSSAAQDLDEKPLEQAPPAEAAAAALVSTFDHTKSGTPSPWAVFDAWGAAADDHLHKDPLTPDEMKLLDMEAVKIPITELQRASLPDESDILKAYDHLLQTKSSVHFGYPYNLMFDFTGTMYTVALHVVRKSDRGSLIGCFCRALVVSQIQH